MKSIKELIAEYKFVGQTTANNELMLCINYIKNKDYFNKVSSFLEISHVNNELFKILIKAKTTYTNTYNKLPDDFELISYINSNEKISEINKITISNFVDDIKEYDTQKNIDFLFKETEKFAVLCKTEKALQKSIEIWQENPSGISSILELLKPAVNLTFETDVGIDFFKEDDILKRYEYYTSPESKVPFDIDILNIVTNGGIPRKTMNVLIGAVNVGKTMSLCSLAGMYLKLGYNVLYVTLEMREEEIAKRLDCNLLDININDFYNLNYDTFSNRVKALKNSMNGGLKIKEYPAKSISAKSINNLIKELEAKQGFKTDVLVVDYLGLMCENGGKISENTNSKYGEIAMELRAVASSCDLITWTAMQFNRSGMSSNDPKLTDIAESIAVANTADFSIAIYLDDTDKNSSTMSCKQLKNRMGSKEFNEKFKLGRDFSRMRLYQLDNQKYETYNKPQNQAILAINNENQKDEIDFY